MGDPTFDHALGRHTNVRIVVRLTTETCSTSGGPGGRVIGALLAPLARTAASLEPVLDGSTLEPMVGRMTDEELVSLMSQSVDEDGEDVSLKRETQAMSPQVRRQSEANLRRFVNEVRAQLRKQNG